MLKKLLNKALPLSMILTGIYLALALFLYFFSDSFEVAVYELTFRERITLVWFHFAATLLAFLLNVLTYFFKSSSHARKIQGASLVMYAVAIFSLDLYYIWGVLALGCQLILLTVTLGDKKAKLTENKDKISPRKSSLLMVSLILTSFYFLSLGYIIGTHDSHYSNQGLGFLVAFCLLHYLVALLAYLVNIHLCVTANPLEPQRKLARVTQILYLISMFVTVPLLYLITVPPVLLQTILLTLYLSKYKEVGQTKTKLPI